MITITLNWLREHWKEIQGGNPVVVAFSNWDAGDAFTAASIGPLSSATLTEGAIVLGDAKPTGIDVLISIIRLPDASTSMEPSGFEAPDGHRYRAVGEVRHGTEHVSTQVQIVDVAPELATRQVTILETDLLADTKVLVVGLGTGGIHVAIELAKCGVGEFLLVDPDRLEVGNTSRHHAGVSQVGRKKVLVGRDLILETNPKAHIEPHAVAAEHATEELIRDLVEKADVVVCASDNRESKLFVNHLCVAAGKPAVFGGAFRRAYGGQILRFRPGDGPCYQCFVLAMPEQEVDREISSPAQAENIAYSDRPVAIEPGLSIDVAPIAIMVAKLALQELVAGKESSLRVLDRDFSAPWYLWINRPETGTPYADWPPLSDSSDEMTILRWYGIHFESDPGCPACGDFVASQRELYGLSTEDPPPVPRSSGPSGRPLMEDQ